MLLRFGHFLVEIGVICCCCFIIVVVQFVDFKLFQMERICPLGWQFLIILDTTTFGQTFEKTRFLQVDSMNNEMESKVELALGLLDLCMAFNDRNTIDWPMIAMAM